MQLHPGWSFATLPFHQITSPNAPELKAHPLVRSRNCESVQPMTATPPKQHLMSCVESFGDQAKALWNSLPFHSLAQENQNPGPGSSPNTPPNTDDALTEQRLARLNKAKDHFDKLDWQAHKSRFPNQIAMLADVKESNIPATRLQTSIKTHPNAILPLMMEHMTDYQKWLPILKSIQVIEKPSDFERVISIETNGRFGIGQRFCLAQATFDMRNGHTQVLLEQLPEQDPRYQQYSPGKKTRLKHFETLMAFSPNQNNSSDTDFVYQNLTDPNISFAPKRMIVTESLANNQSFVDNCSTKLVEFQKSGKH